MGGECRRPEPERRGRCRAGRRSSEGARAGPSPAADPPRRPPSCSLRPPRGHAGASPALRSVACPPCSAASWARRPPALPHAPRRAGRRLFLRRAPGLCADNMEAVKTFNSEVRTAARPPARPQPARGSRAEQGRGPQFPPGWGDGGREAGGGGGERPAPLPGPGRAGGGQGEGQGEGRRPGRFPRPPRHAPGWVRPKPGPPTRSPWPCRV